jgi:hypothetical protein
MLKDLLDRGEDIDMRSARVKPVTVPLMKRIIAEGQRWDDYLMKVLKKSKSTRRLRR